MIEKIRADLQRRRDELTDELHRVDGALAELGDSDGSRPRREGAVRTASSTALRPPGSNSARQDRPAAPAPPRHAHRGTLKAKVLGELHASKAKTAGTIAATLDLAAPSVSAVLVKAVKQGEARKAKPTGYLAPARARRPGRSARDRRAGETTGSRPA
jgi:hypothetical protein